jgi:hypothetical protein
LTDVPSGKHYLTCRLISVLGTYVNATVGRVHMRPITATADIAVVEMQTRLGAKPSQHASAISGPT